MPEKIADLHSGVDFGRARISTYDRENTGRWLRNKYSSTESFPINFLVSKSGTKPVYTTILQEILVAYAFEVEQLKYI